MAHSPSAAPSNAPDPGLIMHILMAAQQTEALKAAVELKLFTHIAESGGTASAEEIAARSQAHPRGIRILCDYLTVHGLLSKSADSRYVNSPTAAAFLDARLPSYMGAMAGFLAHPYIQDGYRTTLDAVRRGGSLPSTDTTSTENPIWVEFARSMTGFLGAVAKLAAGNLATPGQPQKVLDIAAGHGMFGLMVAAANPQADIYALDWPNVVAVAQENADRMGLATRFHTIAGSAFDAPFGSDYTLILVPNFIHHFDHATNVAFLKRCRQALAPGGRVAILEFVPNDDRISPPMPAAFSLQMLTGTPAGDAFTLKELQAMLDDAGFATAQVTSLAPSPQTLLVAAAR